MKASFLIFLSFFSSAQVSLLDHTPVQAGEVLEYRLAYGWFSLGRATMVTAEKKDDRYQRDSYKIDIAGKTGGLLGAFASVNDVWGGVFDKEDFKPYYSYRDVQEGDYILDEKVYFDYDQKKIILKQVFGKDKVIRPTRYFDIEKDETYDLMAGIAFTRSIDYKKLNPGDTIRMDTYFDKEFYNFEMVYEGIKSIRTKVGRLNAYKIVPIMPDNKLFRGRNPISIWFSADSNRLPLKVEADMFFGSAYCELTGYKNVKNAIDFQ
ncbi:MAG: DUF3108 domain-containing protein [Bacteroidota bacterium]